MDNSKNPLTLIGVGIIIGAIAVLVLGSLGFKLEEVGLGPFKFTASTATPTTTQPTAKATPLVATVTAISTAATAPSPTPLSKLVQELAALIETEDAATKSKDTNRAISLYANDAVIIEYQSRQQWVGLDQIRSRYIGNFNCCDILESDHRIIDVKPNPDNQDKVAVKVSQRAKVVDRKTGNVIETRPAQELWYFSKIDGKWKIISFIYNIPD